MPVYGDRCDKNTVCKARRQFRCRDLFFPEDQDILPPANEIKAWFWRVCTHGEGHGVEVFQELRRACVHLGGTQSRCLAHNLPCSLNEQWRSRFWNQTWQVQFYHISTESTAPVQDRVHPEQSSERFLGSCIQMPSQKPTPAWTNQALPSAHTAL